MTAYLAIKFHADHSNRALIEELSNAFGRAGITTRVMARDIERFGGSSLNPRDLMEMTFREIDAADALFVEFSEKGVGLGIESGYAFAKGKPVYVIAKEGSEISDTLRGIAEEIFFYKLPADLEIKLASLK